MVLSPKFHSQELKVPIPGKEKSVKEEVLFKQTLLKLKLANGFGTKFNLIKSFTELQLPLFDDVSVKFTKPTEISAALGVYVAFKTALLGLNEPAPPDQIPVVVGPVTIPA